MQRLQDALAHLKGCIHKSKSKQKATHEETVGQVASYLVFLNSSSISYEASTRLGKCLRHRLIPVYKAFSQPALDFAAALLQAIYDAKVFNEDKAERREQKLLWESVLDALLSGVLDYLDASRSDKTKEAIGAAMYAPLCTILFSPIAGNLGTRLHCTGYNVLSESADAHKANQKRLTDGALLSGSRLGNAIWNTKNYLCMESLLDLFARLIPPSGSTIAGRASRTAFIHAVFLESSPPDIQTGQTLAEMVEHVKTPNWDETASDIVNVLAASNITYSQPFHIEEIVACGHRKRSDRLFVDQTGFLANVLVEEDLFDSLSAIYSTVSRVDVTTRSVVDSADKSYRSNVKVTLDSAPLIGQDVISVAHEGAELSPTITFTIERADIPRLQAALRSRGIGHTMKTNSVIKQSVVKSPAALEIDMAGKLIGQDELDQRIENLSQLYGTNDLSEDAPMVQPSIAYEEILCVDPKLTFALPLNLASGIDDHLSSAQPALPETGLLIRSTLALNTASSCAVLSPAPLSRSAALAPPKTPAMKRTASQTIRDAVFGASDEELSDIECLPTPPRPRKPKISLKESPIVKPVRSSVKTRGRRILDSDDEMPGSTPTKPPTSQRTIKKAVVVSDDEIEDVLPERVPVVSRQRSTLLMTPVTSSMSRRRSVATKPSVVETARSEAATIPARIFKSGTLLADVSVDDVIAMDMTVVEPAPPGTKEAQRVPETTKTTGEDAQFVKITRQTRPVLNQKAIGTPWDEPLIPSTTGRKSIKAALRKKDQHIGEPAPTVDKRKRQAEDEDFAFDQGASRKRTKPVDKDAGIPPEVIKPKPPKQYRGRKDKCLSPLTPAKNVDYDKIPGTSPATSQQQSTTKQPGPTKAPKKTGKEAQKTKDDAKKTSAKDKDKDRNVLPKAKPRPKPRKDVKATEHTVDNSGGNQLVVPKPAPARPDTPRSRPVSPEPAAYVIDVPDVVLDDPPLEELVPPAISEPLQAAKEEIKPISPARKPPGNASSARTKSKEAPWEGLHLRKPSESVPDVIACASCDAVEDVTLVEPALLSEEPAQAGVDPERPSAHFSPKLTVKTEIQTPRPSVPRAASYTPLRDIVSTKVECIDLTGPSPVKHRANIGTPQSRTPVGRNVPAPEVTPSQTPRSKNNVTFASDTFVRQEPFTPMREKVVHRPLPMKHAPPPVKPDAKKRLREEMRATPDITDIASVLDEIQEAILYKITNNIDGVREDIRRGRDRLLAEAASDLAKMRGESIDHYNYLIELEAEYASFGRNLTRGLGDLVTINQNIHTEIQDVVKTHDRASIVKRMPTRLLPVSQPASIKRL